MDFTLWICLLSVLSLQLFSESAASKDRGDCWRSIENKNSTNLCREFVERNLTKSDCCSRGGNYFSSSTDTFNSHIFVYLAVNDLLSCQPLGCEACSQVCSGSTSYALHTGPVCGKDHVTYENECRLKRYNCERENQACAGCSKPPPVEVNYYGECKPYSCEGVVCANSQHSCYVNQWNIPSCSQTWSCPGREQVCGTDNRTYRNICTMSRRARETRKQILLQYKGACAEGGFCQRDERCKTCRRFYNTNVSVCDPTIRTQSTCPDDYFPVCGTDNQTYSNQCYLTQNSFSTQRYIRIKHVGRCTDSLSVIRYNNRRTLSQPDPDFRRFVISQTQTK